MIRPAAACVALATTLALPAPARPQSAPPEHWRVEPFKLRSPGGHFEIALTGYVQMDFRSYQDWTPLEPDTSELRRLRVGLQGRWHRLDYEIDVDPRPEPAPDPGEGTQNLKNAYLEYRFDKAFHVRVGQFKLPFSPDFLTSAAKIDFIERNVIVGSVDIGRDWGAAALGEIGRFRYEAGLFAGDGWRTLERAGTTAAGRLVVSPLTGLDLGASYTHGQVEAQPETLGELLPKGFGDDGPTGFRFAPRHFVNGLRQRFGADLDMRGGPVAVKGEFARGREERKGQGSTFEDLPAVLHTAWSASGTWLITGDKKRNTIRPEHPVPHGAGAIELGVRYEWVRVDDDGPDEGFAGAGNRARNIRPSGEQIWTGGLSWWPRQWMRLMGNAVFEKFEDGLLAPEAGRSGYYTTLLARVQVSLP